MLILSGADVVLSDRVLSPGTIVIEGDRIADVRTGVAPAGRETHDLHGHLIVPGFVDLHVHGADGIDFTDTPQRLGELAVRLARFGVTSFSPTAIACSPAALGRALAAVGAARREAPAGARILPVHFESNFINPEYRGAQPRSCLRSPLVGGHTRLRSHEAHHAEGKREPDPGPFTAEQVFETIESAAAEIAVVTLAPELAGGIELVRRLRSNGVAVSLGHSGATFDEGLEALAAGASRATHLFNRMPLLKHREPGLVGAVLSHEELAAELICDGHHLHPVTVQMTCRTKGVDRVMAISDATAVSGLPEGSNASLGGRPITVHGAAAYLDDGTLAGSASGMDTAFRFLAGPVGLSLVEAARAASLSPARHLGLEDRGSVVAGALADLVVLDASLEVVQTYVGGARVYHRR